MMMLLLLMATQGDKGYSKFISNKELQRHIPECYQLVNKEGLAPLKIEYGELSKQDLPADFIAAVNQVMLLPTETPIFYVYDASSERAELCVLEGEKGHAIATWVARSPDASGVEVVQVSRDGSWRLGEWNHGSGKLTYVD